MYVQVTRVLTKVQDHQDRPIGSGQVHILYAASNDSFGYHGPTRGVTVITFYESARLTDEKTSTVRGFHNTDSLKVQMRMETTIPADFTTYMCRSFPVPVASDGSIIMVTLSNLLTVPSLSLF
jgi:hypothetical protein